MYQPNIFEDDEEQHDESLELGYIGAMKDGFVTQFEFRGLQVRRCGASMEVTDEAERPLGGYCLLESASVAEIHDWLENKAEYYGMNQ